MSPDGVVMAFDRLQFDPMRRRVRCAEASCELAPQQARLLAAFLRRPGQVLTFDRLVSAMYPSPDDEPLDASQGVRIVISRLRARLREIGVEPIISSVQGTGYAFDGVRAAAREAA